jgi:choline dehydrogenase-like flavoprotein
MSCGQRLLGTGRIDPTHYNKSYGANAYLPLASPKLIIMTDTTVAKINLKGSYGYYATGVTLTNGTIINTNQEVILPAGSFLSPSLLEISGIGYTSISCGSWN